VGPRDGLDSEVRGKILCPCPGWNLDRPVVQSVARHYTEGATPVPITVSIQGEIPEHGTQKLYQLLRSLFEKKHASVKSYYVIGK
jgi:hypothetical protein